MIAHRQHVVRAGEYIYFADHQLVVDDFDHVQHREHRVAVLLDLGPLMAVAGIFHRQFMQIELFLQIGEFAGLRVL